MDEHFIKIHKWLYPVSWIYGAVVVMRNKLFDWGIFRSKSFDVPVICVGNLAVGGTGKTPHTDRRYPARRCLPAPSRKSGIKHSAD